MSLQIKLRNWREAHQIQDLSLGLESMNIVLLALLCRVSLALKPHAFKAYETRISVARNIQDDELLPDTNRLQHCNRAFVMEKNDRPVAVMYLNCQDGTAHCKQLVWNSEMGSSWDTFRSHVFNSYDHVVYDALTRWEQRRFMCFVWPD